MGSIRDLDSQQLFYLYIRSTDSLIWSQNPIGVYTKKTRYLSLTMENQQLPTPWWGKIRGN
jgi:hypothetical protein